MIAVDWGTSSFRAYRLDASGAVLERRSAAAGLLACQGRFEPMLAQQLDGWDDELVVMAGMIGSRNGWREVPYVACPAGQGEIAAGLLSVAAESLPGRRIFIAPGLSHRSAAGTPEVMRGEETQLLGLFGELPGAGPHTVCLPGTHSKWATVGAGRISAFHTAMTGELYAVLKQHSLLGALMDPEAGAASEDAPAFELGVRTSADAGGLLSHLFSVRTRGLFGELTAAQLPSYLSGLLIGHELHGLLAGAQQVHLVGSEALVQRYRRALALRHVEVQVHGEVLVARGLHRLAVAGRLSEGR
ncbi:MAG: 2-dehydro-3-deoxygalactonokinase [Burkholderiales bacterium]|nr:2-dehydro-3-deoxygalactonokinase [Burkholderiales bacterium]